jgi:hypothetical protein
LQLPEVGRFFEAVTSLYMYTNAKKKNQGRSLRKDGQITGALIFKQNNSRMVEDF